MVLFYCRPAVGVLACQCTEKVWTEPSLLQYRCWQVCVGKHTHKHRHRYSFASVYSNCNDALIFNERYAS